MPILDMPLHELKQYQGVNPCPQDIDAFWDASIAEMERLGNGFELVPARFQVPGVQCYDMYFTGMGGARIHAKLVRPGKIDKPMPALCHFHGYAGASPEFSSLLSYVQCGFIVAALDCRGQGGLSEDVGGVNASHFRGQIDLVDLGSGAAAGFGVDSMLNFALTPDMDGESIEAGEKYAPATLITIENVADFQ